ncbi:MAG: ComEC/Rec2 family competence protein, partial [Alicyclobacillus sp.]|nr:ComEC/Rec2 family competence protein [Alicyclobacillus sp.]
LALAASWVWGAVRGAESSLAVSGWLGRPAVATAILTDLRTTVNGRVTCRLLLLQLHDPAGPSRQDCRVEVTWLPGESVPTSALQAGATLTLVGSLLWAHEVQRTLTNSPGVGPKMRWQGQVVAVAPPAVAWSALVRERLRAALSRQPALAADDVRLLDSLVFGGEALDPAWKSAFLAAGLLHVLAASGANVLLLERALAWTVFPLWWRLRAPARLWWVILAAGVWGYAAVCGEGVSVVRAAAMASYRYAGRVAGRSVQPATAWCVALCATAVWQPAELLQVSAVLSFLATAAIDRALPALPIHGPAPRKQEGWRRGWRGAYRKLPAVGLHLLQAAWVTLCVEASVLPVLLQVFGQWTPYALVANLVAEPILALLVPLAAACAALACAAQLWPGLQPLAGVCAAAAGGCSHLLLAWVETVAHWPLAVVQTGPLPAPLCVAWLGGLAACWLVWRRLRQGLALVCGIMRRGWLVGCRYVKKCQGALGCCLGNRRR